MADLPDRIMVTWTKGARASVSTPASAGMVRAAQGEYVRALPAVTPATTLADALEVPEIKELVEAARKMEENMGVKGVHVGSLRIRLFYALRRIAEGGA